MLILVTLLLFEHFDVRGDIEEPTARRQLQSRMFDGYKYN